MTIAAHVLYAIAAFATLALPRTHTEKHDNTNDNDDNQDNNNNNDQYKYEQLPDGCTVINTALLDAPTVGGEDDRIDELEAQLEQQKLANAMEAGKAQVINDQLKDQQDELQQIRQELSNAQEQLSKAQKDAQEQRNASKAAVAMVENTATTEAIRAKELEEQLQLQAKELEAAKAAAAEAQQIKALQLELQAQMDRYEAKLRTLNGPELPYYPEVWNWIGLGPKETSSTLVQTEIAYYPSVWEFLGFHNPSDKPYTFIPRAPDPEGLTAKQLQDSIAAYETRIKSLENDAAAAAAAAAEALEQVKKNATEIKKSMRQDPPMLMDDPPATRKPNAHALEPSGKHHSSVGEPEDPSESKDDLGPGADPPENGFPDPANDPSGPRSSIVLKNGVIDTPEDLPNDPEGTNSSDAKTGRPKDDHNAEAESGIESDKEPNGIPTSSMGRARVGEGGDEPDDRNDAVATAKNNLNKSGNDSVLDKGESEEKIGGDDPADGNDGDEPADNINDENEPDKRKGSAVGETPEES